jgi:SAM-dependent methyltransferase
MRKTWTNYDAIADIYEYDMGGNMSFDDIGYYVRHTAEPAGRVLELGCGTGRITLALVNAGRFVTAIDASENMLRRLATARANLMPEQRRRLNTVRMDLRQWALRGKFATILCPYSLITYLSDPDEYALFLEAVSNALLDGGQFICDIFIPRQNIPFRKRVQDYQRCLPDGSILTRSKVIVPDERERLNTIIRCYEQKWDANRWRSFETTEVVRPWQPEELEIVLRRNKFEILAMDFDYEDAKSEASAQFATFRCRSKA